MACDKTISVSVTTGSHHIAFLIGRLDEIVKFGLRLELIRSVVGDGHACHGSERLPLVTAAQGRVSKSELGVSFLQDGQPPSAGV